MLVDPWQPVELYPVARGLRWKVREVLDGWTHPGWPGKTYKKLVHRAAQINQIGGLSAVTESLRPPPRSAEVRSAARRESTTLRVQCQARTSSAQATPALATIGSAAGRRWPPCRARPT